MSTLGFMSTSIPLRERSPNTRNTAISTMTNTGRWIESRVKPIWMPPDDPDHHGDHPLRGYPRVIHRDGQDEQDRREGSNFKEAPDFTEGPAFPIMFILSIPVRMPDLRVPSGTRAAGDLRASVLIRFVSPQ